MKTILITGCGGHFIRDTIRCYRKSSLQLRIIGVASILDENIRPELDEYYQVPASTDPGYLGTLLSLCAAKKVDILIPNVDEEILVLCQNEHKFRSIGTILSASSASSVAVASNKVNFMEFLVKEGIPHPDFRVFGTVGEFKSAMEQLGYPHKAAVIKMSGKAGSVGVRIIDPSVKMFDIFENCKPTVKYMSYTAAIEMLSERETLPEMLVQEFLPGSEYSTDIVADNGAIKYMTGRLNSVCENSIPMDSILVKNEAAFEISSRIVSKLGLDGNIGIDFIFNRWKNPIPIEVNPRITATISLSAAGGVNLAELQVKRLLGYELPDVECKYGTRMIRKRIPAYTTEGGESWEM